MKNNLESLSRIAVFRQKENSPGLPQTQGGVSLDLDPGSGLKSGPGIEHDRDTIHGAEMPTRIFSSHRRTAGTLSQKRARPDFLAFLLAYFFGECNSSLISTTAYRHQISPCKDLELPSFTALQRRGRNLFTERLAGNYVESFTIELGEGWVSAAAEVTGIGAREVNYTRETVHAPADAESITLAENGVAGADERERKQNVYRVRAKDAGSGAWETLAVSAVSAEVPAEIRFAEPLGESGTTVDYFVDYLPVEPQWCEFPPPQEESPLRLVEAKIVVDGYFNGSELEGGEELKGEALAFALSGKNHLELRHFPGADGPAGYALRGGRELVISLTESLRDTVREYQADHPESERLAVALLLRGAEIDPGSGIRFGADLIFPLCGILSSEITVKDHRLARAGDLIVMENADSGGPVIRVCNQQNGYL